MPVRWTAGCAVGWLAVMLAYSPVADWLATRWVAKPPTLGAFKALQQSLAKLAIGIVIAQLSVLFGLLFVLSGYDLWAVMLCHGLYDTIAFIRFAMRRSKYSRVEAS